MYMNNKLEAEIIYTGSLAYNKFVRAVKNNNDKIPEGYFPENAEITITCDAARNVELNVNGKAI